MKDKIYSLCEEIADDFIEKKYNVDALDKKVDFDILKANIIQHVLLDEIRQYLRAIFQWIVILCILIGIIIYKI